jgi:PAS domain S-box-containing protein
MPKSNIALKNIFRHLQTGVTLANQEGNFIYVNDFSLQLTGYNEDELIGKSWKVLYSTEEGNRLSQKPFEELIQNGSWRGMVKITNKYGDTFPSYLHLVFLDNHEIVCFFNNDGAVLEAEQKISELTTAVASAMDGIALLDSDGTYTYLNEKHIIHFGYQTEGELLGKSWRTIYPQHEIERIEQNIFPQLIRDGKWQGETLGIKKDGSAIHQEITLTGLPNGGLICIMRNNDEKKARESEIRRLALVAEKTNNGVIITNHLNSIEWVNKAAEAILEQPIEQITGRNISDLLPEKRKYQHIGNDSFSEGSVEFPFTSASGKNLWLYCNTTPVESENGKWNHVCLVVDISKKKEEEAKLIEALKKERELNALKTNFVTLASHEFRTPLASIQSSIDILNLYIAKDSPDLKDKVSKHLSQITGEVERMTYLMNDVLVMGKINADKIDFNPSFVNLKQLIDTMINSPVVTRKKRSLNFITEGDNTPFYCDQRLITHIIQNLTDNALKYSDPKSLPPVIKLLQNADGITITVTDYGIGIPEKDYAHVFESFWRGSNVHCLPGTGLGLPIVKRFVDLHKGEIDFSSQPGKGTSFTVKIPNHAL